MAAFRKIWTYFVIASVALLGALTYELFVFPNQFAPAGINGICTMIQYLTGLSVGYLSLLLNLPLALWVYHEISRPLAIRSMVYVVSFSLFLLVLDRVDLSAFAYATDNGTSRILGPLVAGVIMGFGYSVIIRCSAYTGGMDFVGALIHHRHPEKSVLGMSFALNVVVAVGSYFVYGFQMEPVLLCILYCFTTSTLGEQLMKNGRSAIRFEIMTDYPEEISQEIIHRFHHSATLLHGKGMYSGRETNVLVCVVNKAQAATLAGIIRRYPHSFAIMSQVSEVMGNFKHIAPNGKEVSELLDAGDRKTL